MSNVRVVAIEIITKVLNKEAYSNLLLNQMIENQAVSPVDVPLLTELVYGTIQHKLTLDYYLSDFIENKKIPNVVRYSLWMAIYQMDYLDKIPDHAIIHEAVEYVKNRYNQTVANFVNAVLRNVLRTGVRSTSEIVDPYKRLSIETSHPEWLVNMWRKQYDFETAKKLCHINNKRPIQFARINRLIDTRENILLKIEKENLNYQLVEGLSEAVSFTSTNIANNRLYKEGYLNIQGVSSMLVGKLMDPSPSETILDACSAPGGKATHLAELMGNVGKVIACDIHEHKIDLIRLNAKRLKTTIVKPILCDATKLSNTFKEESFDRVLIDVPCSGFGVIHRKPEIKYNKSPLDLDQIVNLQREIIDEAVKMVKHGGRLVYSTCTINKKENEKMVDYLLETYPHYKLDTLPFEKIGLESSGGMIQLIDQFPGADVFFIACFKRD